MDIQAGFGLYGRVILPVGGSEVTGEFALQATLEAWNDSKSKISNAFYLTSSIDITGPTPIFSGRTNFQLTSRMAMDVVQGAEIEGSFVLLGDLTMWSEKQTISIDVGFILGTEINSGTAGYDCSLSVHNASRWT